MHFSIRVRATMIPGQLLHHDAREPSTERKATAALFAEITRKRSAAGRWDDSERFRDGGRARTARRPIYRARYPRQ